MNIGDFKIIYTQFNYPNIYNFIEKIESLN